MAINKIQGNILSDNLQRGSNLAFQSNLLYIDVVNNRVGIATSTATHVLTVQGDSNIIGNLSATGNVISTGAEFGNATVTGNVLAANVTVQQNFVGNSGTFSNNLSVTGNVTAGNLLSNTLISNGSLNVATTNDGNLVFTVDGDGIASFASTTSLTIPAGNTAQRPVSPETGAIRFNTGLTQVEVWDGTQWEVVGSDFVSITNQTINGDGSTDTFTLDESTTEAAIIVATNGVVQQPGVAYTVTGNSITFAEAPQISDVIDIRFTAAVTYVSAITNLSGNAEITVTTQGVANIATCDSLQLPQYTVAEAANITGPAAGQIIYVTNGDSGNPCLAVYSGGAWKRVSLGANISA